MLFLGSGAFGEVFEGILISNKTEVSIETQKVAIKNIKSNEASIELLKEAMAVSELKHENIVEFVGICLEYNWLVFELMEGGQLLNYLRTKASNLSVWDLVEMTSDVAKGCLYLEQRQFVHRDLAARNCMLTSMNPTLRKVNYFFIYLTL